METYFFSFHQFDSILTSCLIKSNLIYKLISNEQKYDRSGFKIYNFTKTTQYKSAVWNYFRFEVQQGNGKKKVVKKQTIYRTCKTLVIKLLTLTLPLLNLK